MSDNQQIVMLNAYQLAQKIKDRQLSCREVMMSYLDHIAAMNGAVNAIISLRDRDALLREADEKDAALARGDWQGWMHGFPFAVKDLAMTRGIVTTRGSAIFADDIPARDSLIVERIRAAGAIIIGKTNTPEFGLGSQTYNVVFGATASAWDSQLTAGGSSGGTAAALAMRMLPVADGSDMMGSLRNPAAFNNIFGFRPSQGRVPQVLSDEIFLNQLATEGPMGRCVQDVALLLATLAGRDERAPLSLSDDPAQFQQSLASDCRDLRIGWLGDLNGHLPFEEGMLPLCEKALDLFTTLGCRVQAATVDVDFERVWQAWCVLRQAAVAHNLDGLYRDEKRRALLKPEAIWEIEHGQRLSAAQLVQASAVRSELYRALLTLFGEYDFLVMPTTQVFPFSKEVHWPQQIAGRAMDSYHRWMESTILGSLSGCPILSVPAGFNAAGLPGGLQIIGRPQQDMAVLRLGYAWEQAGSSLFGALPPALRTHLNHC